MNAALNSLYDDTEHIYLELHATAMLCLPSGECVVPDATLCTALTSALYSSVSEEDVLKRQLLVSLISLTVLCKLAFLIGKFYSPSSKLPYNLQIIFP